jgi:hypothetical protein
VWPQLSEKHKLHLVDEIIRTGKALEHPLPSYGSIFFFAVTTAQDGLCSVDETFVIGPSLDRSFWGGGREVMDIVRGPCERTFLSVFSLLTLLGREPVPLCHREQQWIQSYGSSQALHPFRHYPPVTRALSAHLAVPELFRSVIPNIIPLGSPKLTLAL